MKKGIALLILIGVLLSSFIFVVNKSVANWLPAASATTDETIFNWPDDIFYEQFEVGDLYGWDTRTTQGNGELSITSDTVHSGHYAARLYLPSNNQSRNAYLNKSYSEQDTVYVRCHFYLNSDFSLGNDNYFNFLYVARTGVGSLSGVRIKQNSSGDLVLSSANIGDGTTALSRQVWHSLEIKYTRGSGNGELSVWLDGQQELSQNDLTLDNAANEIRVGWVWLSDSSNSQNHGTLYLDDVVVAETPIGGADLAIDLLHPDFRSRIGAPVIVVLTGDQPDDRLEVTLSNASGYNQTIYTQNGPLDGRVRFPLNLSGLVSSTYTLTVQLLDSGGLERAQATSAFLRAYTDDSRMTIDADNNILLDGKKFFPVTPFGLNRADIANWSGKYVNILYGRDWLDDPNDPGYDGAEAYTEYLDLAQAGNALIFGPMHDKKWGKGDVNPWPPDDVRDYILTNRDHPANVAWSWREEPLEWDYTAEQQKAWWNLVKEHDPAKFTHVNFMGLFYHSEDNQYINQKIHSVVYPYLVADIYGFDVYPVEYDVPLDTMARAADNARNWNLDLTPFFAFIQTADCKPGVGGGTPTPDQIKMMSWLMIVHGAKGINWYHHQGVTPPENYAAMEQFLTDVTNLSEAILGDTPTRAVSHQVSGSGRVDIMAKEYNETLYIFAVNLREQAETVSFTIDSLPAAVNAEVYGESRSIPVTDGVFTDDFAPLSVHIYRITAPTLDLDLRATPGDQTIYLDWTLNSSQSPASWTLHYDGPQGDQGPTIADIPASTRAYTLTGLTNYTLYTVTLTAVDTSLILSDTVQVMPVAMSHFIYLPLVIR